MSRPIDMEPLSWLARVGGAADEDLARALGLASVQSARRRLRGLEAAGLVRRVQLLHGRPALWLVTAAGVRLAGYAALGTCSVSASGFAHLLECGHVAATLEQGLSRASTWCGERELRAWEREAGGALASAEVGLTLDGTVALHRPDLVVWNRSGRAVAVEVELTCKAPQRLRRIVRGWARSRCVDGVVYVCSADVARAVERAVDAEWAHEKVDVVRLSEFSPKQIESKFAHGSNSFVPSRA